MNINKNYAFSIISGEKKNPCFQRYNIEIWAVFSCFDPAFPNLLLAKCAPDMLRACSIWPFNRAVFGCLWMAFLNLFTVWWVLRISISSI